MFGRFFAPTRPRGGDSAVGQDQDAAAAMLAEVAADFPAMRPVRPPEAVNDDLDMRMYAWIEQDLREAGYLRAV